MRREVSMNTQQRRHGRKAVCSCCSVFVLCNATYVAAGDTLVRTVVCLGLEAHSDLASSWPTRAQPRKLRLCLDVTAPLPSPAHVLPSRHLSLPLPMDLLTIFGCFCRPLQWGMVGFESGECWRLRWWVRSCVRSAPRSSVRSF